MGVHSNAEKIVREYGYSPATAQRTRRSRVMPSKMPEKADSIVLALDELLTREGMVRIYALLQSALQTASPKFDIGEGPKAIARAMEKKLKDPNQQEMLAEIKGIQNQLDDLTKRFEAAAH